jgi:hypothetical protein
LEFRFKFYKAYINPARIPTNLVERVGFVCMLVKKSTMESEIGGNVPFHLKGPEYPRLRKLMNAHGADIQNVSYLTVYSEDPFFKQFKLHSLKMRITYIKRKAKRDHLAMMRK